MISRYIHTRVPQGKNNICTPYLFATGPLNKFKGRERCALATPEIYVPFYYFLLYNEIMLIMLKSLWKKANNLYINPVRYTLSWNTKTLVFHCLTKYSLKLRTWHLNPRLFRFRIFFIVITIMQIAANIMTINPSKLPSKPIEAKWSPKASIERRRSYTVKNKSVLVIFWFLFSGGNTWIGY